MKSKSILYALISLSLVACAPTPEELAEIKKNYSGSHLGISGLVVIQHAGFNPEAPELPPQISAEFERESSPGNHLMLARSLSPIQATSINDEAVSLGCNEDKDIAELPATLDVDTLKICGKHTIRQTTVKINAKKIILDNAALEFIPLQPLQKGENIQFTSEQFQVDGESKITLQGATIPGGREMAPTFTLNAGLVEGSGHLKIYSKASVYTVNL